MYALLSLSFAKETPYRISTSADIIIKKTTIIYTPYIKNKVKLERSTKLKKIRSNIKFYICRAMKMRNTNRIVTHFKYDKLINN